MAKRQTTGECELCGDPATKVRTFISGGRVFDGLVCDQCGICDECGVELTVTGVDTCDPDVTCGCAKDGGR